LPEFLAVGWCLFICPRWSETVLERESLVDEVGDYGGVASAKTEGVVALEHKFVCLKGPFS